MQSSDRRGRYSYSPALSPFVYDCGATQAGGSGLERFNEWKNIVISEPVENIEVLSSCIAGVDL